MRLASSFGGGVGRLRELCGALSGALMALGLARGYDGPETGEVKAAHYALVRRAAAEFRRENGAVLCRELLGPGAEVGGTPAPRTAEFYASRPCLACIRSAAAIAGRLMDERPETT